MILRATSLVLATDVVGLPVFGIENLTTAIAATTEDVDFPASNLLNPATHLKWVSGVNTGDEYITVNVSVLNLTDYFAIAKHNFGTAECTVSLEVTADPDSPYNSPGFTEIIPPTFITSDAPIIFQFTPQFLGTIRLRIQGGGDTYKEAAVVYVGKLLTMERGIKVDVDHTPINFGRKNDILNGMSESGNFLGRIIRNQMHETKAEFSHVTNDWYRAYFDAFVIDARGNPFFFAWAPAEYVNDVGYCWLTKDVMPEMNPVTRRFDFRLEMRGVA